MIDKKKSDVFILLGDFVQVLNPGQILSALPLKIVLSGAKFVKSWQIIRICKALVKWQKICLRQLFR